MSIPITVAVYVDSQDAIRATRNKWGWLKTKLDLSLLDEQQRITLSKCSEDGKTIYLTHIDPPPRLAGKARSRYLRRDRFDLERHDGPLLTEATPETALAVLMHLQEGPGRARQKAVDRFAAATQELERVENAAQVRVEEHLSEVDAWLALSPEKLVTEDTSTTYSHERFTARPCPERPYIWGSDRGQVWQEYQRAKTALNEDETHAVLSLLGDAGLDILDNVPGYDFSEAEAEAALSKGLDARRAAIKQHKAAVQAVLLEMRGAFARRIADAASKDAEQKRLAEQCSGASETLRQWATQQGHTRLVEAIDNKALPASIVELTRAAVFDPLSSLPRFRKITKTDLMSANPELRHLEKSLEAHFAEDDAEGDEAVAALCVEAIRAMVNLSIPTQRSIWVHRGWLTFNGSPVGVLVQKFSTLLEARFENLRVSRAFGYDQVTRVPIQTPAAHPAA